MEITANAVQTVAANQNLLFTDTIACGNGCIIHRDGSGLVTLRGLTNQCRARFKVSFGGNIGIPTTGTAGSISLAIAVNGETIDSTTMIETLAAVDTYDNVFSAVYVDVPAYCCVQVSVKNTSADSINVQNANLIVERVA
jgi:hypothetical protein